VSEAPVARRPKREVPPLPADQNAAADAALEAGGRDHTRLLVVLHHLQHSLGFIPPATVRPIARALGLSRAEVHGVISFYHDFRTEPGGQHHVKVCQAESCQAAGGRELWPSLETALGCAAGETAADGSVTLEVVYCLGLCAASPALLIDDEPVGRLTEVKVAQVAARARSLS
jgi:NADH:ubiquinone oxidoreductase subunit E